MEIIKNRTKLYRLLAGTKKQILLAIRSHFIARNRNHYLTKSVPRGILHKIKWQKCSHQRLAKELEDWESKYFFLKFCGPLSLVLLAWLIFFPQQTSFALVYSLQKITTQFQALCGSTAPRITKVTLCRRKSCIAAAFVRIHFSFIRVCVQWEGRQERHFYDVYNNFLFTFLWCWILNVTSDCSKETTSLIL